MDADLIGIDFAHLLLKYNLQPSKQRPVKAGERAAESAVAGKETRAEAN